MSGVISRKTTPRNANMSMKERMAACSCTMPHAAA
jgi:hypothetical protein